MWRLLLWAEIVLLVVSLMDGLTLAAVAMAVLIAGGPVSLFRMPRIDGH